MGWRYLLEGPLPLEHGWHEFAEVGVVLDREGRVLHWHLPSERTAASLPDSRDLWDVLWEHRASLGGFAHSHPGSGLPEPSHTDLTTFAAIEAGLGRRLTWWITSRDQWITVVHRGRRYEIEPGDDEDPPWLVALRHHTWGEEVP